MCQPWSLAYIHTFASDRIKFVGYVLLCVPSNEMGSDQSMDGILDRFVPKLEVSKSVLLRLDGM